MSSPCSQRGFTVAELLVSLMLFGVVGASLSGFMIDTMRRVSLENRMSSAAQEAQNAMQLMISELRLGSQISPYLPGTDTSLTSCSGALSVTGTTVSFIAAHDDQSGVNGLNRFYVGYRYDSASKELIRGEIATSSPTSCTVPAGNPTDSSNGATIATKIIQVDVDNNGTLDPIFSIAGDLVTISFGVEAEISSSLKTSQIFSSEILLRSR